MAPYVAQVCTHKFIYTDDTTKFISRWHNETISIFVALQEMEQMKSRIARDEVQVEVDSGISGPDLGTILNDLRTQYEGIVKKNKDQAEQWYRKKVWGELPFLSVNHWNITATNDHYIFMMYMSKKDI